MIQASIILKQLEESSKKIISKTQKNSNEKTEIKKKISTCSNSIFEVLPSSKENNHSNDSEKTLSNSEEKLSDDYNRKEFDDLQKLVNELIHQNEELKKLLLWKPFH